jgi:internalin A
MKKFELCYALDNQTVLIPDLLEIQEPAFYFDYANALKFRLDYDFLPKSVMPRFIVKSHKDIKDKLRWRTGVVLTENFFYSTAVIKSDNEARKIFIYVTGAQPRDYYATIRKTFRDINDSFEKLEIVERVCLPDEPTVTVSISHLYRLEKMGQITYIPEGANKAYNVKELLGAIGETNEELQILKKLEGNLQEEKEPPKTDTLLLQPNFFGIGINFNQLFKFELSVT